MANEHRYRPYFILISFLVFLMTTFFLFRFWPLPHMAPPQAAVLMDRQGNLMGAAIADDGQWRFPDAVAIPEKLNAAILTFEDRYFYYHPGINPVAMVRAIFQNAQSGRVVSGASTITMQVARMIYQKDRTYVQKMKEIVTSLALEARFSKDELLLRYVSMAPYGGNVVGLEAATWRYFGRPADQLSWAESALLAILPNQPSALFPGRSATALKAKRDRLLSMLLARQIIDSVEFSLSVDEPLPTKPFDIPTENIHLLQSLKARYGNKKYHSSIDAYWQSQVMAIAERYHRIFMANGVENLAALVVDLSDNKVLAYVGNTADPHADGRQVDIIQSKRSSGSLLKPLLMAGAIDRGLISPLSLLPDIPTFFSGFTPKNFNLGYEGAIAANEALARSLNIPFVHLLRQYNYEQFQVELIQSGFTTIDPNTDWYGLSLVLGGAEVRLWDVAKVYAHWYQQLAGRQGSAMKVVDDLAEAGQAKTVYSDIATWQVLNAMTSLVRPGIDQNWESFSSSQKIAWKTGTSIGFRDAWAVGLNGTVLAAVWVGNADGEGRAGLVGSSTAGSVLLEILGLSNHDPDWLEKLKPIAPPFKICAASGDLAAQHCNEIKEIDLPESAERIGICPFHHHYYADSTDRNRVNTSCYPIYSALPRSAFALPPSWAYYYKRRHPGYEGLPPMMSECMEKSNPIDMIYPTQASIIYIPKGAHGKEKVVLQASHAEVATGIIYWHIDNQFIGQTQENHEQVIWLGKGEYKLMLTDALGNSFSQVIKVVSE